MRTNVLGVLLAMSLSAATLAQSPAAIQTPEAAFGHKMGADRELADWPSLQRYFESLAAASDRVELVDAGPTTEGRRLIAAIVSSPENIKRLEEIRANALRLAEPRRTEEPAALAIAEKQDRKSTRLNSSHGYISYAVFCLKKKKNIPTTTYSPTA